MSDSKATTAEPVAWMVWQPMGGPARFTTDAKGVADLQSRADMTVTPLVRYDQAAALLQSRDATIEGLRAELAERDAGLVFTMEHAKNLLEAFGGEETEMTVRYLPEGAFKDGDEAPDWKSPAGLYAHCTEYPEEGYICIEPAALAARQGG